MFSRILHNRFSRSFLFRNYNKSLGRSISEVGSGTRNNMIIVPPSKQQNNLLPFFILMGVVFWIFKLENDNKKKLAEFNDMIEKCNK